MHKSKKSKKSRKKVRLEFSVLCISYTLSYVIARTTRITKTTRIAKTTIITSTINIKTIIRLIKLILSKDRSS